MSERRRLLVALVVPGAVATEIDGLRRALGSREIGRIAPHVTLVPPINLPAGNEDALERHLREVAADFSPVELTLGPPASFEPRPVLYLAVESDPPDLGLLAEHLASGPLSPPPSRSDRAFVPHVTLVSGAPEPLVLQAKDLLGAYRTSVRIEELSLLEQEVEVAGHPWHTVSEVRLGRPAHRGRGGRELQFHLSQQPPADLPLAIAVPAPRRATPLGEALVVTVTEGASPVAVALAVVGSTTLFVESIDVLARHRGGGVGGQLLGFLERLAAERNRSEVVIFDRRSPAFLARHGYQLGRFGLFSRD